MELSHVGTISESATAGTCDHSKAILHDATVHRIADKAHDGRPDSAQAGQTSNARSIAMLRGSSEQHRPNFRQTGLDEQNSSACSLHQTRTSTTRTDSGNKVLTKLRSNGTKRNAGGGH